MSNYRYNQNRPWDDPDYRRHELPPPLVPLTGGLALAGAAVMLILAIVLGIMIWG